MMSKLVRKDVPPIPLDAVKRDMGPNRWTDVYDAVLDGHHCRWRCSPGKKYPLAFIRYHPQGSAEWKDFPWKEAWFSARYQG